MTNRDDGKTRKELSICVCIVLEVCQCDLELFSSRTFVVEVSYTILCCHFCSDSRIIQPYLTPNSGTVRIPTYDVCECVTLGIIGVRNIWKYM